MQMRKSCSALQNHIKHLFDCHLSFKQMYEINLAARLQRGKPFTRGSDNVNITDVDGRVDRWSRVLQDHR
tara:strand:+ start:131 stop:340 length:210 start_codon:yes stop_codon:yes gene_type:complete